MLSTKEVKNAGDAQSYFFGHDEYYLSESELGKDHSAWWGRGAEEMDLQGPVDGKLFNALLKGQLPSGQQLGRVENDQIKHRPGFDLTLSVPKSVSLLLFMGDDKERIFDAIWNAAYTTLNLIENACAQARTTKDGITSYENTRKLVGALMLHGLSRENDPQAHIHCIIMNMTQRSDGQWRALASKMGDYGSNVSGEINGFFERVRHHRNYFGGIFQAELAFQMKQLGYNPVKTGKNNFFEIEGISQKALETYSERSKQIEQSMKEKGFSSAKAAAVATLDTRKPKEKDLDFQTLQQRWKDKGDAVGVDAYKEVKDCTERAIQAKDTVLPTINTRQKNIMESVQYAIDHLSNTQIAIKEVHLINLALTQVIGGEVGAQAILQCLKELQVKGELIPIKGVTSEILFTTKTLLDYEKQILSHVHKPHRSKQAFVASDKTSAYLASHNELTAEQKNALRTLMANINQVGILEGPAGTGKTTLMKPLMELTKLDGYQTILLTPSKADSVDMKAQFTTTPKNLWEWLKQTADNKQFDTVSRFLKIQENEPRVLAWFQKKTAIFVDQATILSTKQMRDLVVVAEKMNARLIFSGDKKSVLALQSGTPFTQLIDHGVTQAILSKNMREQSSDLKSALADTLQGNLNSAFEKIGHRILSVETKEQRLEMMAAHYVGLSDQARNKTLVLMNSKAQCDEINLIIREALKKEGQLKISGVNTTVFVPRNMSDAEYRHARNYAPGQWVRFNDVFRSLKVQRGDYCRIASIQEKQNVVVLVNARGKHILWDPLKVAGRAGTVEVFEEKNREIAIGDTLNWRRNDPLQGIHNGERLKVSHVLGERLTLIRDNQKTLSVNLKDISSRHFDYGYATTPYQKLHTTAENVIAYQNSFSRQSHQRLFYKTISQALNHAWIYTEDKNQLLSNLQTQTGNKTTAIAALLRDNEILYNPQTSPASDHIKMIEKAVANVLENIEQKLSAKITPDSLAQEAVKYALAHLAEREAAFEHKSVMDVALRYVLGEANVDTVQKAVLAAEKNGELIRGVFSRDGTRWTTAEAIKIEREIVALATVDKGKLPAIAKSEIIEQHLQATQPKDEHANVVREMATFKDRVLLVQGYAGTGKTTLLKNAEILFNAATLFDKQGYQLIALAPTHTAVKEIKARGLTAQTLDSFLVQQNSPSGQPLKPVQSNLLIAVDESSMVSNRRMRDLLETAQTLGARLFIIGDTKQYAAIESGKPTTVLQMSGVKTVYLTDIERQKDPTLLKAVKETYNRDFAAAFKTLESSIIEIPNEENEETTNKIGRTKNELGASSGDKTQGAPGQKNESEIHLGRFETIRDKYLERTAEDRAQTLVITWGNKDRVLVNALIREGLKKEGELNGLETQANVLISKDMTRVEQMQAQNYAVGNKVRFNYRDQMLGIEKNDYLSVYQVLSKSNLLMLEKENGQRIAWLPAQREVSQRVEVYETQQRSLMAGDLIRWTRTDKALGFFSPELMKVAMVHKSDVQLVPARLMDKGITAEGDPVHINLKDKRHLHWDHAYAITGYGAQSKTIKNIILHAESYSKNLTSQSAFLVGLTRAAENIIIVTDNKEALIKRITQNKGEKTSALETIGEIRETIHQPPIKTAESAEATPVADSPSASSLKEQRLDGQLIAQRLHDNAEFVLERLLGEPKEKTGTQYRYGTNKGSLVITLQGDKRGLWHDFQTGEGGNLLNLIAIQHGLNLKDKSDFPKILERAAQVLGSEAILKNRSVRPVQTNITSPLSTELNDSQQKMLKYARTLVQHSLPVKGTLAERYLREHRHINLGAFPDSVRFHPAVYSSINNKATMPALLVVARDKDNKVQGVQAVYLDSQTAAKAKVKVVKQTFGPVKTNGAAVHLSSAESKGPVYLAEGPETALSILQAMPNSHVLVTLGKSNFKNVDPKFTDKNVVLCLDNDEGKDKDILIEAAAISLKKQGKEVWVAKPENVKDYNDILMKDGTAVIKANIEKAILYNDFADNKTTEKTLKTEVLDKIKKEVQPPSLQEKINNYSTESQNSITKAVDNEYDRAIKNEIKIEAAVAEKSNQLAREAGSISQRDIENYIQKTAKIEERDLDKTRSSSNSEQTKKPPTIEKELEI